MYFGYKLYAAMFRHLCQYLHYLVLWLERWLKHTSDKSHETSMRSTASTKVLKFRERHFARCRLRVNSESTTRLHDFFKISVSGVVPDDSKDRPPPSTAPKQPSFLFSFNVLHWLFWCKKAACKISVITSRNLITDNCKSVCYNLNNNLSAAK